MIAAAKNAVVRTGLKLLRAFDAPGPRIDLAGLDARRVLVVQGLRIGDTVATLPALAALRRRWPDADVLALAPPPAAEVLELSGLVDDLRVWPPGRPRVRAGRRALADTAEADAVFVFDCTLASMRVARGVRARARVGYDWDGRGVGLTHPAPPPPYWHRPVSEYPDGVEVEPQFKSWLRLLREAGLDADAGPPSLTPRPQDIAWADAFLGPARGRPRVALHPGAEPAYQWPAERFAETARALAVEDGADIILTGGPADAALAERIADRLPEPPLLAAGKTSVAQMAALLARVDLLISVDTSAGHLAAAAGRPVVSLFGPGDPRIWAPQGDRVEVVAARGVPCLGCKRGRCRQPDHPCMTRLRVEDVLAAARRLLDSPRPKP